MRQRSPLPNRVDPFGRFLATPARGTVMGNRGGRLHRDDQSPGRRAYVSRRWICCVLAFKGRQRQVWGKGYSELFFLDEVVALAAGHRPCAECRRAAFRAYAAACGYRFADEMDMALRQQRLVQPSLSCRLDELPDGAVAAAGASAVTRREGRVYRYSPAGWEQTRTPNAAVTVLTPALSISALGAGYRPIWHPSAMIC
ncbi:hypothetical protein [Candidatus Raskinella chloraquaticus]|uniref:hypothetical protein n=1 Tax=Candidatus Raskinella chloraquaticus TaxID=1951219 RepID=UPI0026898918